MKRAARPRRAASISPQIGVAILAGGLSTRMGRDKAGLRLQGKPLLQWVRGTALRTGHPVRVIRRDLLPRCGPLSGIHAALATARAEAELFLACDMPFIEARWLRKLALVGVRVGRGHAQARAVFSVVRGVVGFPCLLRRSSLDVVQRQIAAGHYSLQQLAVALDAERVQVPATRERQFVNINTAADWAAARHWAKQLTGW